MRQRFVFLGILIDFSWVAQRPSPLVVEVINESRPHRMSLMSASPPKEGDDELGQPVELVDRSDQSEVEPREDEEETLAGDGLHRRERGVCTY